MRTLSVFGGVKYTLLQRGISSRTPPILVLLLMMGTVVALTMIPRTSYCTLRSGMGRDICYFMRSTKGSPAACGKIEDRMMRDVCLRDNFFIGLPPLHGGIPEGSNPCNSIEDPFLEYECMRVQFRPHTMYFLLDSSVKDGQPWSQEQLKAHYNALSVSVEAARRAGSDSAAAEHLCLQLPDERQQGECIFFIAVALAARLVGDSTNETRGRFDEIMGLCSRASNDPWRSECYYVLADELALMRPEAPLEEVKLACEGSTRAAYWYCHDHVVSFLPASQDETYCSQLRSSYKADCYQELGARIAEDSSYNVSMMRPGCAGIPPEYQGICQVGFAARVGTHLVGTPDENIERCDGSFVAEPRRRCFEELGLALGGKFHDDISIAQSLCNMFPEDVQKGCFVSLGWTLDYQTKDEIRNSIKTCEKFPPEFKEACLFGLVLSITLMSANTEDISRGIEQCGILPGSLPQMCRDQLALSIISFSGDKKSKAVAMCSKFPESFRPQCFSAIIEDIYRRSLDDYAVIDECAMLPAEFQEVCFARQDCDTKKDSKKDRCLSIRAVQGKISPQ